MQNRNVTELDTALPEELGEPMDVVTTPQAQETTGDRSEEHTSELQSH